jgi:hypothetical protein
VVEGAEVYEVGDQVGLGAQFGAADSPVDPTRVLVSIRDPEGRTVVLTYGTDAAVLRTAPGSYQVVVVATVAGRWQYRFVGTGGGIRRGEYDGHFDVFDITTD